MKIWEKIMESWVTNYGEDNMVFTKEGALEEIASKCDEDVLYTYKVMVEIANVDWSHKYYGVDIDNGIYIYPNGTYIYPLLYEDCIMDCEYELHHAETLCQDIVYTYLRYKGLYDEKVARTITISLPLDVHHCIELIQEIVNDETFMNLEYIEEN